MEYWLASQSPSDLASHTLVGDRLVIVHEADGRRDELLFSDIRTMNLKHTLGAYVMRITRHSGRDIIIRSRYVAGRRWEDRVAVYAALVTELHEAVQVECPIQFVGGSTPFYWIGWAILAIGFAFVPLFLWARLTGHAAPPRTECGSSPSPEERAGPVGCVMWGGGLDDFARQLECHLLATCEVTALCPSIHLGAECIPEAYGHGRLGGSIMLRHDLRHGNLSRVSVW